MVHYWLYNLVDTRPARFQSALRIVNRLAHNFEIVGSTWPLGIEKYSLKPWHARHLIILYSLRTPSILSNDTAEISLKLSYFRYLFTVSIALKKLVSLDVKLTTNVNGRTRHQPYGTNQKPLNYRIKIQGAPARTQIKCSVWGYDGAFFAQNATIFLFPADIHLLVGDVEIHIVAEARSASFPDLIIKSRPRRSTDTSGRFALVPSKYEAASERNGSLRNSTVRGCRQLFKIKTPQ